MSVYAELALPEELMQTGGDPTLVRDELLDVITRTITAHPRSAQKRIGPSEIGTPCQRRLGYRLAGVEKVNDGAAWRPTVGTAVHEWLEWAFLRDNHLATPDGATDTRWLLEHSLDVGEIAGVTITGKCDIYDRITATSIDWKNVGVTTLRSARANGPSPQYRAQAHLYGRGWARRGLPIETVAVFYLPSNGELSDAHYWHEPYNEQIALDALTNATTVATLLATFGPEKTLPILTTADAYCTWCPFFCPAVTDLTEACPGHDNRSTRPSQPATAA